MEILTVKVLSDIVHLTAIQYNTAKAWCTAIHHLYGSLRTCLSSTTFIGFIYLLNSFYVLDWIFADY